MENIKIYIDNNAGDENSEIFAISLKHRLISFKIDAKYEVKIFSDLNESVDHLKDPDNELSTIKAVEAADIVIPIVTSDYISFVTPPIEKAFNSIIESKNRYLFPFLLKAAEWSNHDWLVKTQLAPSDAVPFYEYGYNEREKITNEFLKIIRSSVAALDKFSERGHEKNLPSKISNENVIFISHDHDDADFAELLKLKLEKENIESWIDTERLKIGQDWREEIDQGIDSCAAMIVIMTPDARKSEYVTYEWAFAWGKQKTIFPIMLKQTQLHPRLESLQYINFTNNATRPWDKLIASVKQTCE